MCKRFGLLFLLAIISCTPQQADRPSDSTQADGNPESGKLIYEGTCKTCHSENAIGDIAFGAPALANIDDWYLRRQLHNFRNETRGYLSQDTFGIQMAAMAKTIKDTTALRDVVSYIQRLPQALVSQPLSGDVKKGENLYQSFCGSCHGPNGKGNRNLNAPRLNGLQDWYLKRQLRGFRNQLRGAHPDDLFGAQMVSMASMLQDTQSVDDVVAYILSADQKKAK